MQDSQSNGHDANGFGIDDKQRDGSVPSSQLDLHDAVINPPSGDPLLETTNLGIGNLSESQYWLQVQAYESVIYAQTFGDYLIDLARHAGQYELGARGWQYWHTDDELKEHDGVDEDDVDSRVDVRERGEHIWELLPERERIKVIDEYGGLSSEFLSAFWRMLTVRNEVSRSKNAQLLDNYFGRKSERKIEHSGDMPQGRLRLGGDT
jgi:hypothetical protein